MATHPTDPFVLAHQDWECGRDGHPCRFGPEPSGQCSLRAECSPRKQDERWICSRPLARGGPCDKGPLPGGQCSIPPTPCVPRATAKRRLKTAWRLAGLSAVGLGLTILFGQIGTSPGPVMSQHAAFEEDCARCHADIAHPSVLWVAEIVNTGLFGDERKFANADKCMACHNFGAAGLLVHGSETPASPPRAGESDERHDGAWFETRRPPLETRLAAAILDKDLRTSHPDGLGAPRGQIPCIACHREHEGRDFIATTMTDTECQVCHAKPFAGFSGHPPFTGYPHQLTSRVAFDHSEHIDRHFPRSARKGITPPENCGSCHNIGEQGAMVTQGFATCSSCHEDEITNPAGGSPDLEFLAPPGLDLESLSDVGIGDWPFDAEAAPNAFLRFMLNMGNYLEARDLEIVSGLDLLDLTDASDDEKQAAARLAWAFKQLAQDLTRDGPAVFVEAARNLYPEAKLAPAWTDLAASLPFEVVSKAARQWFPKLDSELDRHTAEEVPTREIEYDFNENDAIYDEDDWLRYGGWQLRDMALVYRPTGHADRFLHSWLTFSKTPTPGALALFEMFTDEWSPAVCAKCHIAEDGGQLNWFAQGGSGGETVGLPHLKAFSHLSHRQAISEEGCTACHTLAENQQIPAGPAGFTAVQPDACGACHNEQTEIANCLTCHDYHFENANDNLMRAVGGVATNHSLPGTVPLATAQTK